ncbi:unnamed protein product [Fraxinus pennsylvanica]|uniref:Uncharacterized protein n=1 Tax=Fraxinus pennsylvanica TaxID=56036 RepID=A0AAD2AFJ7_9LAMI|nr:unnamed protein product [Fraxinus pennsylvanica]
MSNEEISASSNLYKSSSDLCRRFSSGGDEMTSGAIRDSDQRSAATRILECTRQWSRAEKWELGCLPSENNEPLLNFSTGKTSKFPFFSPAPLPSAFKNSPAPSTAKHIKALLARRHGFAHYT